MIGPGPEKFFAPVLQSQVFSNRFIHRLRRNSIDLFYILDRVEIWLMAGY